jgi:hypothetical protein
VHKSGTCNDVTFTFSCTVSPAYVRTLLRRIRNFDLGKYEDPVRTSLACNEWSVSRVVT